MFAVLGLGLCWSFEAYFTMTAALTAYVMVWTINMSMSSLLGVFRIRRDTKVDWHMKLEHLYGKDPVGADIIHFVILPAYAEEEAMMKETLLNLAKSKLASTCMRVVLAMEMREGVVGRRKAENLIAQCSHMFAGLSATFHPANLPNEIPGKSSNEQWAFREIVRTYNTELQQQYDPSKVFITISDADTIWHSQYFSCMTYQGLTMSREQRTWQMWQPPVMLLRNYLTVPGLTRVSGVATVLFELSGLANQHFGTHITFSSYSLTLALANHPAVRGWDGDVIAEDHHMFVKCYMAPMWESAHATEKKNIKPKVRLNPVYLPALGFMAESADGSYVNSLSARFAQARRHSQGIAELGYVLLCYVKLVAAVGFLKLPFAAHRGILNILWKMFTVHITNSVQAMSLVCGVLITSLPYCSWIYQHGFFGSSAASTTFLGSMGISDLMCSVIQLVVANFGPVAIAAAITTQVVVEDVLAGSYDDNMSQYVNKNWVKGSISWFDRFRIAVMQQFDVAVCGEGTVILFGLVPEVLASWSLFWRSKFEYIAAPKPSTSCR